MPLELRWLSSKVCFGPSKTTPQARWPKQYRASTGSWASIDGQVGQFDRMVMLRISRPSLRILEVIVEPVLDTAPLGEVKSAAMVVNGRAASVVDISSHQGTGLESLEELYMAEDELHCNFSVLDLTPSYGVHIVQFHFSTGIIPRGHDTPWNELHTSQ